MMSTQVLTPYISWSIAEGNLFTSVRSRTVDLYYMVYLYHIQLIRQYSRRKSLRWLSNFANISKWKTLRSELEQKESDIEKELQHLGYHKIAEKIGEFNTKADAMLAVVKVHTFP